MLLSLCFFLLIACVFGFKQSRDLKRSKDLTNKQGLELALVRTQYKHNLSLLSQALKDKEDITYKVIEDLELELQISLCERPFQDTQKISLYNLYINSK